MRDLLAIAEHGSLRAAARRLNVAQPALTRSIRELEGELGGVLFERSARGMVATAMGELLIRRAQSACGELRRAREEIGQLRGETTGRTSVCLGAVPHIVLLPFALSAFRARYPDVFIDIHEGRFPTIEASLRSGVLDCYVGPMPRDAPGKEFLVEKLFDQNYAVLARKGHPLARARSMRELADAEWLTQSITVKPEQELRPIFDQLRLPPPRLVAQSHAGLTFLTVIANSDLLMMLPSHWVDTPLARNLLRRIDVAEKLPCMPIVIIRRAGIPLTPAAEYFCDMIRRASAAVSRKMRTRGKA